MKFTRGQKLNKFQPKNYFINLKLKRIQKNTLNIKACFYLVKENIYLKLWLNQ